MSSGGGVRVSLNFLLRAVKAMVSSAGEVTVEEIQTELGLNENGARKLISLLTESGDIDRVGSRRAGYKYVRMSPERVAELAPVIDLRDKVLAQLAKAGLESASGTLSRVSLTLRDFAALLEIPLPESMAPQPTVETGTEEDDDEDEEGEDDFDSIAQ